MNLFKKPILFVVLVAVAFIVLSWIFSSIFIYLVISIILSTILRPLTNYLSNQQFFNFRMPRVLAVFISFFSLILLLSAFVTLFLPLISDQIDIFSSIDMEQVITRIEAPIQICCFQFVFRKRSAQARKTTEILCSTPVHLISLKSKSGHSQRKSPRRYMMIVRDMIFL